MKRLSLILFLIVVSSCNYFEKKKVYSEDLLKEELQTFNWKDVDEYPTFASCDSTANKKVCFENTLRSALNNSLLKHKIVVTQDVHDTIVLKITIDKNGLLSVDDINTNSQTKLQIPEIDSLLRQGFDELPKIFPAIKRSQQVATQFNLPVVVQIN